jgi:hypothetical protein
VRKIGVFLWILLFAAVATAGFRAKNIKPKRPERFQVHVTIAGVTYASDLLLNSKEQRRYFPQELTSHNIVALRLAIFNKSSQEVQIHLEGIHLTDPEGKEFALISPDMVSQAVLLGYKAGSEEDRRRALLAHMTGSDDPRSDKNSPDYDPRRDPNDSRYDPRADPIDPNYNPINDPTHPSYSPQQASAKDKIRIDQTNQGSTISLPDILNGRSGNPVFRAKLIEKDFMDKAYWGDPVLSSMRCDKFLYFTIANPPASVKGFELRLFQSSGNREPIILKF